MSALTERSAVSLAASIRRRELTATEVVEAHIDVLVRASSRLNAIAADRFEQAREQAREFDREIGGAALRGAHLDDLPPLVGVPFTVTESIALEGMPNSAGVLVGRGQRPSQSASAVKRLVEAGAIPLGVTNTSELTLRIESANPVHRRANNPYDPTRTAGGSSGGEGATVGSGGSPFGVASDIGGSIRVPALFCGVFGHKPSAGLVPNTGVRPAAGGESESLLSVGFLSRRAEDLLPLLKIVAGPDGWDARAVPIELGDPAGVSLDGLRVTVIEDSSRRPIAPALREARALAMGALASAGARIRSISLPSWRDALPPSLAAAQDTGGDRARVTALLKEVGEATTSLRALLFGEGRHTLPTVLAELLPSRGPRRDRLLASSRELVAELTEAIGDGVLLHPAYHSVAPRHRHTYGQPWLTTPAAIFNLAGVPVTEVPLGLSANGLPVGVQVASAHGADHLTIAIALELEAVFGGWVPPAL